MRYRPLGRSGLQVSVLALGTKSWGEVVNEPDAHRLLDAATDAGINLVDTAEMYPVPCRADTQGAAERILGSWLAQPGRRERLLVATSVAGPMRNAHDPRHLRGGATRLDRPHLTRALEDSLRRLRTGHVDLYQIHWPDRTTNTFGRLGYPWIEDADTVPIAETLGVLGEFIAAGKVRHIGVSNETPWGVGRYLVEAGARGLPRIAGIQNPYNLLNRTFETGMAEYAHREQLGLLAYSPLAFGAFRGVTPGEDNPLAGRQRAFDRYGNPFAKRATDQYVALAREYGIDPSHLALAFVLGRPFVTSAIIGATSIQQLCLDLAGIPLQLAPHILQRIDGIHIDRPNPAVDLA